MREERGMAFALTLIVVMAIASLTLAILGMAALEPRLTANLSNAAQARFAAEAGMEWAVNTLAGTTDWNTVLNPAGVPAGAEGVVLNLVVLGRDPLFIGTAACHTPCVSNQSRGSFSVSVRNDWYADPGAGAGPKPFNDQSYRVDDRTLTGWLNPTTGVLAVDPSGTPYSQDTNDVMILWSTGCMPPPRPGDTCPPQNIDSYSGDSRPAVKTMVAAVKKANFPPLPAALAFPGNEAETNFNGNAFEVNGTGMHMDGTADAGCQSVLGISVSAVLPAALPGQNETVVQSSLSREQKDNVTGKNQSGSGNSSGDNTIATELALTPTKVAEYINQAKQSADLKLTSSEPSGLSFSNIGDSCSSNYNSPTCWGTAINPKIVWVKGSPDPSSLFTALTLSGHSTGYGILIVEDGDFKISGDFAWYGVIIVTGQWVGLGFMGGGEQQVYGSVVVNETATDPGYLEGLVSGNAKIRYSCDAINLASGARRLTSVANWREAQ